MSSRTASSAAETSPSVIRRTRAPASRIALDAVLVARAVEHDDHDVADVDALALGDQPERLGQRAGRGRAGRRSRRRRPSSPCRRRGRGRTSCRARRSAMTRERARHARARVSRVPSSGSTAMSTCGRRAVADVLAVVEHRRLVLLALADHDDAVHRDRVEHVAHRVDGRLVGGLLVARGRRARAAASAAASVTRTSSRARLRSGRRAACPGRQSVPGGLRLTSVSCWRKTEPTSISNAPRSATYQPNSSSIAPLGSPGRSMMPL